MLQFIVIILEHIMPFNILTSHSVYISAHPRIEPRSFLQADVVESYAKDYMFISCIEFINKVKNLFITTIL